MNELSMSMLGSQKDYWKARAEQAEDAYDRVAQMGIKAEQRIEQLEVLLSDALRQFGRWENGYAYDMHGEERNVERRIRAALAQSQEADKPETLPLMAMETFKKLFINASGNTPPTCSVNEVVYRIADHDEHGLPVVKREPGMDPWAKYVYRANGWISYYRDLPAHPDTDGFQRIEDYNEQRYGDE